MAPSSNHRDIITGLGVLAVAIGKQPSRAQGQVVWSPVRIYGGYQKRADSNGSPNYAFATACGCKNGCTVHGHAHAWGRNVPISDAQSFWGALGCSCWAF